MISVGNPENYVGFVGEHLYLLVADRLGRRISAVAAAIPVRVRASLSRVATLNSCLSEFPIGTLEMYPLSKQKVRVAIHERSTNPFLEGWSPRNCNPSRGTLLLTPCVRDHQAPSP